MSDLAGEMAHVQYLIASQRWDEALRAIGPLRRDHPDVGGVWRCQAEALRGAGHTIEALVAVEKWMQVSPGCAEAEELHREIEFERLMEKTREAEIARNSAIARMGERGPDFWNSGYPDGPFAGVSTGEIEDYGAPSRRRRWSRSVATLIVVAMVAAPLLISRWRVDTSNGIGGSGAKPSADEVAGPTRDRLPTEVPNPVKPSSGGSWEFLNENDGVPVRHDPCTAIHYKVRIGSGPPDAVELARESIAQVGDATGLLFIYDGTTDEIPRRVEGSDFDRDTPLVIAWASPNETDLFSDAEVGESSEAVGVGGPVLMRSSDGSEWYVGGFVVIRTDVAVSPGFGPGTSEGNVLLHELGHVVGLGHVEDANELMAPWTTEETRAGYGPGDLYGLWRLGASQGCL